jgi:4-carboxymuconolactone decarboxylase
MTTNDQPADVLLSLLSGVGAGKWNELHNLYSEDTVVRHPLARDESIKLEGREALRRHFAHFAESGTALSARDVVVHQTTDPEVVVGEFVYDGNGGIQDGPFEMAACFVWRVRDGQISEAHDYLDRPRPTGAISTGTQSRISGFNDIDPDETTETRRLRGEEIVRSLSGGAPPASLGALQREFPFLSNAVNAYAVGEIFARDILDVRTRQLSLVAAFAALGLADFIKIHAGYALNAGVSEDELKEIVYLTTIPGGFPRAIQASAALSELFAQRRRSAAEPQS